ncbi:MAG: plasmid maintenance system killer protein [Candidatus Fraserbacteria bacterium RBG_16_55_9]|uniref:Plasmid maintenance system killer protein n=1 Tax=Fraserbacteria sp. (strain RBG_16_55_9) TaxID=1817864 RepID=A0A1F5UTZ7_FRAXR|nr:MAG: plasmid maintenance system killer protein [Candidatus Fraserbacteria bacterium RBG_16_55_9]
MIISFTDRRTERIFNRELVKGISNDLQDSILRKLRILHRSMSLNDLRVPLGNRLEKLKGDREGQYSIRVNDPWRICFNWHHGDASNVEAVDYH